MDALRGFGLMLVLIPMGLLAADAMPEGAEANVLSTGDGDTVRVRMNGKPITMRLACVDAPETAQRPYGQNARQYS